MPPPFPREIHASDPYEISMNGLCCYPLFLSVLVFCGFQDPEVSKSPKPEAGQSSSRPVSRPKSRPTSRPVGSPARNPARGSPEALAIAKKAKTYSGGDVAWSKVKNLVFTFRGHRRMLWDRKKGLVRIEPFGKVTRADPEGARKQVMLYDQRKDKGWIGGKSDKVTTKIARATWVNDTYWLLFSLKLLDPGTRLRIMAIDEGSMGEKKPDPGILRLHMSFDNVGVTPKNEYVAWIEQKTGKILRWDYYRTSMEKPLSWYFEGYKKVGPLLLSLKRTRVHDKGVLLLEDVDINVPIPDSIWKSTELMLGQIGRKPRK